MEEGYGRDGARKGRRGEEKEREGGSELSVPDFESFRGPWDRGYQSRSLDDRCNGFCNSDVFLGPLVQPISTF